MGACYLREFRCSNVKIFYSKAADVGSGSAARLLVVAVDLLRDGDRLCPQR